MKNGLKMELIILGMRAVSRFNAKTFLRKGEKRKNRGKRRQSFIGSWKRIGNNQCRFLYSGGKRSEIRIRFGSVTS
jgi:hypothetical protein